MTSILLAALILASIGSTLVEGIGRGVFLFRHNHNKIEKTVGNQSVEFASNDTIVKHGYANTSDVTVLDYNYKYYQQTVLRANRENQTIEWIDLDKPLVVNNVVGQSSESESESSTALPTVIVDDQILSKNYLHSRIVWLKFKFPFYGHMIDRILVTNVGFIYAGTLLSPYISKAQYIAPLMANFDATLSPNSSVKYVDNSTHFVCTWQKLRLSHQPELGEYTFQVVVGIDGKIVFNYLSIPTIDGIEFIKYNETVKMGLSDAYMDYKLYIDYFNTDSLDIVAEYGLVQVLPENVKSGNSIILFMLKNCFQQSTCEECVKGVPNFECIWCPSLQRCSDTYAVEEAEWKHSSCPESTKGQTILMCTATSSHLKIDVGFRPDWIGAEAEVHRSLIKSLGEEEDNTFNMTLFE